MAIKQNISPQVVDDMAPAFSKLANTLGADFNLYNKNGRLVFYYSNQSEEGKQWETRIWFNAKGMFKSSVKADGRELNAKDFTTPEYSDFKPKPTNIIKEGKRFQELFTKQMEY